MPRSMAPNREPSPFSPGRNAYVSEFRFGRWSVWSQWLTVMLSWVNSPVQIRIPITMRTIQNSKLLRVEFNLRLLNA